jgi:hypothetical protein
MHSSRNTRFFRVQAVTLAIGALCAACGAPETQREAPTQEPVAEGPPSVTQRVMRCGSPEPDSAAAVAAAM